MHVEACMRQVIAIWRRRSPALDELAKDGLFDAHAQQLRARTAPRRMPRDTRTCFHPPRRAFLYPRRGSPTVGCERGQGQAE